VSRVDKKGEAKIASIPEGLMSFTEGRCVGKPGAKGGESEVRRGSEN